MCMVADVDSASDGLPPSAHRDAIEEPLSSRVYDTISALDAYVKRIHEILLQDAEEAECGSGGECIVDDVLSVEESPLQFLPFRVLNKEKRN